MNILRWSENSYPGGRISEIPLVPINGTTVDRASILIRLSV